MSKLTAEDYLNWFKLKPPKLQHTKLPKQKRYYGDEELKQREMREIPVQLYQCRQLGQLYAQRYQDEHIRQVQKAQERGSNCNGGTDTASVCGSVCSDPPGGRGRPHRDPLADMGRMADMGGDTDTLRDTDTLTHCDTLPDTVGGSVCLNDADTVTVGPSLAGLEVDTLGGSVACGGADSLDTAAQQLAVYQNYDFSYHNPATTKLPVYNYKKEILNRINIYQVIVIEGKTGCGKSTQVPQYILDEAASEGCYANICVTQPRKIAAVTLAKRVCEERKWQLGSLVGYQVGLDNCTSEDTRLVYLTTEVLVQKIIAKKSLSSFTHIVLDEVHERDQHTDFALLLVKKLLNTVSSSVKVILMSATIDVDKFARYYATPVLGHLVPAPILSVSDASQYNTSIYYLEQLAPIFKDKMGALRDEPEAVVTPDLVELVVEVVKRFDRVENTPQLPAQQATETVTSPRGAVLVFVPGIMEIENIITKMRACADQCKWTIFPLHSSITVEEQKQAFGPPPAGRRKVIVTTNVAESSITVPDVRYVIDLCLTKTLYCDPVTNFTCLKLDWASKASCDQRAGRAGRTSHGRVYRMVTRRFYQRLSSYSTPELVRCPLSLSVLKTKRLDLGEPAALLALALDPPNLADIARTILTLKQLGCLSMSDAHGRISALDGELTHLGRITAQLPLDPHCSKLIVLGQALGCLRETVIIAAGLSLKTFHSNPFQDELNAHLSKMSWAHGSFSDCIALLNAYNVWQNLHGRQVFRDRGSRSRGPGIHEDLGSGGGRSSRGADGSLQAGPVTAAEVQWAKRSYVQLQQLREVHKLVAELTDRLDGLHITPCNLQQPSSQGQDIILKLCIAAAFYPHYFCRYNSPEHERDTNVELCGHDPYSTVLVKRLPLHGAVLYEGQIRDMFRECASNITIEIENSTAYVMFRRHRSTAAPSSDGQRSAHIPGEYPTALYLALKMVQVPRIRDTLQLSLYSSDDTDRLVKALDEEHSAIADTASTLDGTANTSLSRATSCLSIDTSATMHSYARVLRYGSRRVLTTPGLGFKPPELPGSSQLIWKIHVQHVESAGRLWVISEEHAYEQLQFVMSTIRLAIDSGDADQLVPGERSKDAIPLGEPVLAPYTEQETGKTVYRRAQIEERRDFPGSGTRDANAKLLQVLFVDYGNSALVPAPSLRQMPHSLGGIPRLAVECCLSEVRPASSSCDGAAWSDEANAFARDKLAGRSFLSKVYSSVHGVMRIQLYVKHPQSEQLRCFNDVLVRKRFAVHAQESLQSQNDNQSRQSQLYSVGPSPAPPLPSQRPDYELTGAASSAMSCLSLTSALSTVSLATDASRRNTRPSKNKARVLGPYSPLQLRFYPLYRTTESKAVRVEAASVNSTALDMEPQNPHDRLMVASIVSLSANESSLIARNTTLMPPIPGLMSLSCLTFCHLANMRVSEDGCEYTGAVVGLGADPATGHPLYPDEDIEVTFDVPITNDTLEEINKVRYLLSSLMSAPPGEAGSLDLSARAERQGALRRAMLRLLDDHKRYTKPVYSQTPYKWNVIPESELLQPISSEDERLPHHVVYPLHCGVALRPHTPATLMKRVKELVRSHRRLLATKGARLERSNKVWEICYACDAQLVTVQDVEDHLESTLHKQKVARLEQLFAQQ